MRLKGYAQYCFKRALEEKIDKNILASMVKLSPIFFSVAVIIFCLKIDKTIALIWLACVLAICSSLAVFHGNKKAKSEVRAEDYQHPLRRKI
jgi:hypothetical protein